MSSNTTTYIFNEGGVIPGIPRDQGGEGHAGQHKDVDLDTMTVTDSRLFAIQPVAIEDKEDMARLLDLRVQTTDGKEILNTTVEEALNPNAASVEPAPQDYTTQPLEAELAPDEQTQLPFPGEAVASDEQAIPEVTPQENITNA